VHAPTVTFLSYADLRAFTIERGGAAAFSLKSDAPKHAALAESLMLGRGDVCVGTPRSTFSKLATTWWSVGLPVYVYLYVP